MRLYALLFDQIALPAQLPRRRRGARAWCVVLSVALVAGVLPGFEGGAVSAQVHDSDAQASGALDLGDVTDWSDRRSFDDGVDGTDDAVDYFKFSLSEPKLVDVRLRRLQLDADIFLEDSLGTVLASGQETGTTNESISVGLNAGQYFLRVLAKATGTNTYRLRLGATEAPQGTPFLGAATIAGGADGSGGADGAEDGLQPPLRQAADDSTREGAQDLGDLTDLGALGPAREGQWNGDVRGTDDAVDYFAFSLSESKLVGAGLSRLDNDADIFLEDSSGTVLASSRNLANRQEWLNVVLAAGSYFIRVEAQTRYRVEYTLAMGTARPDSAAAGFDTTAVVGVGSQLQERIGPYWDIDWVRVELVANHVYVLEVRGRDSQSGTLMDPELLGVHVDPADSSVFDAYRAVGRVVSGGRICDSGMSDEALAAFPDPPDAARDWMVDLNAYDLDDGVGQDAWLLIRAEATGSHYIEIVSQGGFAGSYTVAAAEAGTFTPGADGRGSCPRDPDDAVGLVVDPGSLSISENGSGSFAVRLATRPSASVSVSVSSGDVGAVSVPSQALVFTTGNWSTAQSVAVGGVDDADADDESVTVTLTASSSDLNYEGETASVSVSVIDDRVQERNEAAALVVTPDALVFAEDGFGRLSVSLATEPSHSVSVTASSGDVGAVSVPSQALVFTTGNWSTPQSVTVRGVIDDDALDESVNVSLTASSSDSDYEGETATRPVTVSDVDMAMLVVDPDSLTVSEDGSGTFEVSLATRPSAQVSVTVSSGDAGAVSVPSQAVVFTTGNWSTAQLVTVGGVDDDDAGDELVTVTVTASGGDYGGETAEVEVSVSDGDTAGLVVDPDSLTVSEDGSGTFEVRLATRPSAQVSVTVSSGDAGAVSVPARALVFTTGDWSTAQSVTVEGVDDEDALGESVTVTVTASGGDYGGETAEVDVSVTDGDTAELVVDPDSLTISENGSGTFEVSLATRPSASVSVTVSSGDAGAVSVPSQAVVFTTGNWSTAQSVTVEGVDDDDVLDESVTVTVTASGGDYGGETAEVEVSVADDETAELVVDPDSLTISEDGSGTFELRLASRPSAQVSVTVSSGDSGAVSVPARALVFTTGNWSTAQSVTVEGVDDDDALDESVTVTVTASGGDYGGETAEVEVSVADDETAELVVDPDSLTISEDGSGTFELRLATRPSAQVSVTVSSGDSGAVSVSWGTLLFTTGNWSTARSVTVSGVDDNDALDESVTVTLTASAGDYNGVTAEVDVSVADDDTAELVVDPDSLTVAEGGSGTFFVRLATRPSSSVSVSVSSGDTGAVSVPSQALTFTTGNWSTARSVTVGGVDDADALDESVTVTVTASGGDYGGVTAEVDVSVTDGDTAELVVDPDSLTVAENGSGTFSVRLATRPSSSVSVRVSSGDTGAVSVPSRALTFTTGNWSTAQSVAVGGVDDADADDESVTVTLTASSSDLNYEGETASVSVSVIDDRVQERNEAAALVVTPDALVFAEDGFGRLSVSLATEPSHSVSVTASSGDVGAVSVPSQALVFTKGNWSTPQSVTVRGVIDDDALDESVNVSLTASSSDSDYEGETATRPVTVDDVDMAMLVVDPDSLTISEDGSGTFEVSLATRPSAQVSVTVSSGDSGAVSVSWGTLLFTTGDWSTARSVTVGGVDDDDADDELVTVTVTASAGDYGGVTAEVDVSVTDDDTAELVVDPDSLSISEDGSGNVSVSLATRPSASVSVRVSSGDADAVSVPSQAVVFTTGNWSTARSVTVEGVDDADALDELVTVTLTASGGDYGGETATVVVSVADDDTVNLVVDPGSLPVSEDGSGNFEVRLATRPSAQVSVTVSSGDAGAVSVPARALVFTTGNWSTAQSVTVEGVDDDDAGDESVTVTLTASGGDYGGETATVSVSVADDDDAALVVDPDSLTVAEGGSGTFEVSLATRPSVSVSVRVSSGDPGAVSVPARALVFTTGNWSTAQSVTVGGVDDDDAGDESVTVTVTAAGGDYGGVTAEVDVSVTDGDAAALVVDPDSLTVPENGSGTFAVRLATRPSASVSVTVSSGDTGAVSVPSQALVFTTGDWSTAQSVAVGGVVDADALDESVTVTLTAYGGDYGGETAEVEVSVSDDDTAAPVVNPDSLTISENGSGTFEVSLATRPSAQRVGDGVFG